MTRFEMISDEDLIKLIRDGNKDAEEYLMKKYIPMVNSEVRTMFLVGAEIEDLTQEGMIGLFEAIRDYDLSSKAKFKTFAYKCIRNRCSNAITSANRMKHSPLNNYLSFFYKEGEEDNISGEENEYVSDGGINDPENIILKQEAIEKMYEIMEMKLSTLEKKVVRLYISGLSRQEIADALGKSEKTIDNALTRIHNKLKNL